MSLTLAQAARRDSGLVVQVLRRVEGAVLISQSSSEGRNATVWVFEEELEVSEVPKSPPPPSQMVEVPHGPQAPTIAETVEEIQMDTPPPLRKRRLCPPPRQSLPWNLPFQWEYSESADGIDANLLIFFHGLGDSETPFLQLGRRMALPQTALLSLRAPYALPLDLGSCWFQSFEDDGEIIRPTRSERRRVTSLRKVINSLRGVIAWLCTGDNGWTPDSIFLFGYSQGGTAVLHLSEALSLSNPPLQLGGAIVISASFLEEVLLHGGEDGFESNGSSRDSSTPLLLIHGSADETVPLPLARLTLDWWKKKLEGTQARLKVIEGKRHGMIASEAEMRLVMEFFARHLKRRYPALESSCIEIKPGMLRTESEY